LYQWKFLPFGLKNALAEFQRVMDKILTGLDFVRCYIDDIMVYSDTVEEHQIHLQIVFEQLKAHGLCLHLGKCHNPSLGLTTKARVCKVVSQEGSWESHNILPGV
jgi:hypothetical protein